MLKSIKDILMEVIMDYIESLEYINRFINYERQIDRLSYEEKKFYLERMRYLLNLMDNPHHKISAFHVAGTKGKGSTSAMIFSILKEAGFKAGLYTSPHLQTLRERIATNDGMITQKEFVELVNIAKPYIEKAKEHPIYGSPTFFEVLTALAFLYFFIKKLDYVVIEVGLGGRLDATNVIKPIMSVITPIGYDHMHILGDTLEKIAYEKAGIIKKNIPVVSAPQKEEAWRVISSVSTEREAPCYRVDHLYKWQEIEFSLDGQSFCLEKGESKERIYIPLLGRHQIVNAVTAYGAIDILKHEGKVNISYEYIKNGLAKTDWKGRFQIVNRSPLIIVDGAHNVDSAIALRDTISKYIDFDRLYLICGLMKDKDAIGFLNILDPIVYSYNFVPLQSHRTRSPEDLSNIVSSTNKNINVYENFKTAIEKINKKASPTDLILITGSLYLVGEALDYFYGKVD